MRRGEASRLPQVGVTATDCPDLILGEHASVGAQWGMVGKRVEGKGHILCRETSSSAVSLPYLTLPYRENACQREPNRHRLSRLRPWLRPRPRAHPNPLYSGWRAENVTFGTQPGVALKTSAERLCSKIGFHPPRSGEVSRRVGLPRTLAD